MAKEGKLTKTVEKETATIPSMVFLGAAALTTGLSICLKMTGCRHSGLLVGQWTAPLLLLGIYNKIVKTEGHD